MDESFFIETMDAIMISVYKITQEQLNKLFDLASDEELENMVKILSVNGSTSTFTQKRKSLEIKHKYLNKYGK